MHLEATEITDLNVIARWLAQDSFAPEKDSNAEIMILAGHAVVPNIEGALQFVADQRMLLLISGGVGHSTELLHQALTERAKLRRVPATPAGKSEAAMIAQVAVDDFGVSPERILIEDESANCGQNASFSLTKLLNQASMPQRIILVQDPLMQRRTMETFCHVWRLAGMPADFTSWPVFTPQLMMNAKDVLINGAAERVGLWSLERFVSMAMGEVRRLRDDAGGYGPAGAGFIGHVDIPPDVESAWQRLVSGNENLAQHIR